MRTATAAAGVSVHVSGGVVLDLGRLELVRPSASDCRDGTVGLAGGQRVAGRGVFSAIYPTPLRECRTTAGPAVYRRLHHSLQL